MKIENKAFTLYANKYSFHFRIFHRGYMVFMLTLWDNIKSPLIWWSKINGIRHEFAKSIRTKANYHYDIRR